MAIHSSILAWEGPWTEESGGLQSMGPQELDTTYQLKHPHYMHPSFASCVKVTEWLLSICLSWGKNRQTNHIRKDSVKIFLYTRMGEGWC